MARAEQIPHDKEKSVNAEASAKKKRKPKEIAPCGSYKNYYGFRLVLDLDISSLLPPPVLVDPHPSRWRLPISTTRVAAAASVLLSSRNFGTGLSVTKWIHLNWEDDGLVTLFANIWRLLHPGGILVLEPQPWNSYYSNGPVMEAATANFKNVELYPEGFQEILLDEIGFKTIESVTSRVPGTTAGFNRPVLVLRK